MQVLYSMFPDGRAGSALLLLRLSLALAIFLVWTELPMRHFAITTMATTLGLLLCIGLATAVSAVICVLGALGLMVGSNGTTDLCLALAAGVAIAVALLGPGAFSLDARLFGRKRMRFEKTDVTRETD